MQIHWPCAEYDNQAKLIANELLKAKNIFCIAHPFADGDALGSELALYHFCKELGKSCVCLNFDPLPEQISWLNGSNECKSSLESNVEYDLAVLLETTEAKRMGERASYFSKAKMCVHLDHHPKVSGLGQLNIIDDKASSTCEILYNVLEKTGERLNKYCREALYVGIMTDTGNFRYTNSTPRSHEIVAKLIESGLNVDEIYKKVYENTNFNRVLIHGLVMSRVKQMCQGKLVYSFLTLDDFKRTNSSEVDADGAVRPISCIKGAEIIILFKELVNNRVKFSLRSAGTYDVMALSRLFGGGGHKMASGGEIEGELNDVIKKLTAAAAKLIAPSLTSTKDK